MKKIEDKIIFSIVQDLYKISETLDIEKIIEKIKSDVFEKHILQIRNENSKEKRNVLKKKLPGFTPSGTFHFTRNNKEIAKYSGLVGLDFDNLDAIKIKDAIAKINGCNYTRASFISPSGNGLKVFIETNASVEQHSMAYIQVQNFYDKLLTFKSDPACKDIARLCFFSYDPNAYFNGESKIYEVVSTDNAISGSSAITAIGEPNLLKNEEVVNVEDDEMEEIVNFTNKIKKYKEGDRNNYIFLLASNCNTHGIIKEKALSYAKRKYDLPEIEIINAFNSAYSKVEDFAKFAIPENENPLSSTPYLPDEIFGNLPPFFNFDKISDNKRQRDVFFLSSLTVFSGGLTNVSGLYNNIQLFPNLFSLIVAPPASGKGVMTQSKDFGLAYHRELLQKSKERKEKYLSDLELFKASKKSKSSGVVIDLPKKPLDKTFFIPANTSQSKFFDFLKANDGMGVIFDTEADVLSGMSKQDWGINSTNLRAGFHNETISVSRKGDDLHYEIETPKFSICLSGTPDQVPKLLDSIDNGLFSRFLFYTYKSKMEWNDPSTKTNLLSEVVKKSRLGENGKAIFEHYEKEKVEIKLTKEQWQKHNLFFKNLLKETKIHNGENTASVVFRLGTMAFKLYMTLTVIRNQAGPIINNELRANDIDVDIALKIIETCVQHSLLIFNSMPKRNPFKFIGSSTKDLLSELPNEFSRKEAVELGTYKFKLSEKSVDNFLKLASNEGVFEKLKAGLYRKNKVA